MRRHASALSPSRQMGYAHVGNAIYLSSEGRVEVVMNSTQRLGEGLGVSDLTPAVRASVGAAMAAKVGWEAWVCVLVGVAVWRAAPCNA